MNFRGSILHKPQVVFYSFFVFLTFFAATDSRAQISPGELAKPHAHLEGMDNCLQCHELGGGPSAEKCLSCHLEIKTRIDQQRGLHHQVFTIDRKACFSCHSDHAGRAFKMVFWENGQDNFDHKQTGFSLKGKHAQTKCQDCHKSEFIKEDLKKLQPEIDLAKTFLGLQRDCISCHVDEHRGQLDTECSKCHTEENWKPAPNFDHDNARFQLTGKHIQVDCAKCHPQINDLQKTAAAKPVFTKFTGLPFNSCKACHDDVHKGKFGADCQSCHTTTGWRGMNRSTFDHSKTRFPLLGKHQNVDCQKCHTSGDMLKPLQFGTCAACHKDVHEGKLGQDCQSCHNERSWKTVNRDKFDHSTTGFPLRGLHASVDCQKCHTSGSMTQPLKSELCSDCHKDIHLGQFAKRPDGGRCEVCHDEQGFIPALYGIREHQQSGFQLIGSHIATQCRACHKLKKSRSGEPIRQFVFSDTRCETCHQDIHVGQFSKIIPVKSCEICHQPTEWPDLQFNHDADSRFPLKGAHQNVQCNECHKLYKLQDTVIRLYRPIDPACETCHSGNGIQLRRQKR